MGIRVTCLAVVLCALADGARAAQWVVNEADECVHVWSPSSIARGPLAMTNALTMPVRQLAGGAKVGYEDPTSSTGARILRVPALALLGLGTGTAEALFVMIQGLSDFLTGGYFDLVPDDVATPGLEPMTPRFLEPRRQAPPTDPCGRNR
ncbi:MAG: hypothetical protein ACREQL_03745 [Candidatus Binatia bacterium]